MTGSQESLLTRVLLNDRNIVQETVKLLSARFEIGGAIIGFEMVHFDSTILHTQSQHLFESGIRQFWIEANDVDPLFKMNSMRGINVANAQVPKVDPRVRVQDIKHTGPVRSS